MYMEVDCREYGKANARLWGEMEWSLYYWNNEDEASRWVKKKTLSWGNKLNEERLKRVKEYGFNSYYG